MIEIFISQPAIDFTPDKLSLIAEALEELGHNLIEPPRNCRRPNFLREYDNPGAVHLIYPQVITA